MSIRRLIDSSTRIVATVVCISLTGAGAFPALALGARGPSSAGPGLLQDPGGAVVPTGTRTILRLEGWLSSKDAQPGDRFETVLVEDLTVDGEVVVPAGAVFGGRVVDVEHARQPAKGGELMLVIDKLVGEEGAEAVASGTIVGLADGSDLEGDDVDADDAKKGGILGGVIGGILGGVKGALIGLVVGAGGGIVAGSGDDVDLPAGTLLRVRFDREVEVTWTWRPMEESAYRE
jgi:hypothetical protein